MKKVLALFLSFVLLGSTCSVVVATTQTQSTVLYGDVSGDGVVSSADALMILQSVVGKIAFTSVQQHLGRVTAEVGAPDTADALEVLRHIVGKQPRFVREKEDIAIMLPTYSWEYTKKVSDKYEQVQVIETYEQYQTLCDQDLWNETAQFDKYTADYFEKGSLFVIAAHRYRQDSPIEVEFMWVADGVLQIQMADVESCIGGYDIPELFFITEISKIQSAYDSVQLNVFHWGFGCRRDNPACWKTYTFCND